MACDARPRDHGGKKNDDGQDATARGAGAGGRRHTRNTHTWLRHTIERIRACGSRLAALRVLVLFLRSIDFFFSFISAIFSRRHDRVARRRC